jgi:hypothetical protein
MTTDEQLVTVKDIENEIKHGRDSGFITRGKGPIKTFLNELKNSNKYRIYKWGILPYFFIDKGPNMMYKEFSREEAKKILNANYENDNNNDNPLGILYKTNRYNFNKLNEYTDFSQKTQKEIENYVKTIKSMKFIKDENGKTIVISSHLQQDNSVNEDVNGGKRRKTKSRKSKKSSPKRKRRTNRKR